MRTGTAQKENTHGEERKGGRGREGEGWGEVEGERREKGGVGRGCDKWWVKQVGFLAFARCRSISQHYNFRITSENVR